MIVLSGDVTLLMVMVSRITIRFRVCIELLLLSSSCLVEFRKLGAGVLGTQQEVRVGLVILSMPQELRVHRG